MREKTKNIVIICIMTMFFLGSFLFAWIKEADEFSDRERRLLKQFPEVSWEQVASGRFMTGFESYALDQFPFRDNLRTLKTVSEIYVFGKKDYHGIYIADGYLSKMEYPMDQEAVNRATTRFQYVYEKYMKDTKTKVYFSIVPDKNYFLARKKGYLSLDYKEFFRAVKGKMDFMEYIDITQLLTIEDYYQTDTHWRQEDIRDVAEKLGKAMGVTLTEEYEVKTLETPFYGVYHGQLALPLPPEQINYLTSETLKRCQVYDFQNGKKIPVYDMEKAYGKDPYEMFLSGSLSLLTIENPDASSDKELILFRDSFGSSIAPLFVEGYKKVTLVDIRYIQPDMLGRYIEFDNQDVLFLYSTLVLNQGETIK